MHEVYLIILRQLVSSLFKLSQLITFYSVKKVCVCVCVCVCANGACKHGIGLAI